MYEMNNLAIEFYHEKLMEDSKDAEAARKYLKERGFNEQFMIQAKLGYAGRRNQCQSLHKFLTGVGVKREDILDSSLVRKNPDNGSFYDFFEQRIIMPIFILGQCVYMSGRDISDESDRNKKLAFYENKAKVIMDEGLANKARIDAGDKYSNILIHKNDRLREELIEVNEKIDNVKKMSNGPKYLNLPGRNEYFINEEVLSFETKRLFLSEGWFDTYSMMMAGFDVAGIAGCKKTSRNFLKKLSRSEEIAILFDNEENEAGINGAKKMAFEIAKLFPDKKIFVCSIPRPKDKKKIDINEVFTSCINDSGEVDLEKFKKRIMNIRLYSKNNFIQSSDYRIMLEKEIEETKLSKSKTPEDSESIYQAHLPDLKNLPGDRTLYRATCPFHKDSSPSFTIFKDYGWKCFSCNASGNADDLVEMLEKANIRLEAKNEKN